MAKNIFKVSKESDYEMMVRNNLVVPHIVLIEETGEAKVSGLFRQKDAAEAGDLVCFVNGVPRFVRPEGWNDSLAEKYGRPEAMVIKPSSHTEDGRTVCMSIELLTDGINGKVSTEFLSSAAATEIPSYDGVCVKVDNMLNTTYGSGSTGYLPSTHATGTACAEDAVTKYIDTENMCPSPYGPDGSAYAMYNDPMISPDDNTTILNVLANEVAELDALIQQSIDSNAFNTSSGWHRASVYSTPNIQAGQWSLASCNEIGYIVARKSRVLYSLGKVDSGSALYKTLSGVLYGSETEADGKLMSRQPGWFVDTATGEVGTYPTGNFMKAVAVTAI